MSNSLQNVSVSFKVAGSELSQYIDTIQRKSDQLTNTAIKGALEQSEKSKDQLKLINEQIAALERKTRIETQAARSTILDKRDEALVRNKDYYDGKKNQVFSNDKLSEDQKKEKLNALEGVEKEKEQRIKNDYRENLTVLREQERQARLQTQLAKENVDTLKQTAKDNVKAIISGDKRLEDVLNGAQTEDERLVAKLTEEGVKEERRRIEKEKPAGIMGSLLAVDNINKLISSAGQLTSTQNGFDLIQPASNTAGRIIGGILGGLVGAMAGGVGAIAGAGVGSSIGGGLGDALGAFQQREALTKEGYFKALYRYRGITGGTDTGNVNIPDLQNAGIDVSRFIEMQGDYARRRGYSSGSDTTTRDAIYAEKGYGVDQGTSQLLIELQRSAKEENRDLAQLIGGVIEKGTGNIFKKGDTTFLNEFLGKFTTLQKEFLKSSTTVATGTTMDILSRFNKVGGEFDVHDPRSMGNIQAIQNALANPSSDNLKALSFGVLRSRNPNAGVFDLLEERQKGLNSPEYLKGMLGMIDRMGGDDQSKMLNMSNMFSGLPLSAVRRLFKNRDSLMSGSISMSELQAQFPTDFKERAEGNTTDLERNTAMINNGILGGEAVSKMADAFVTAIKATLGGAVINLNNGQGSVTLLSKSTQVQQNETRKASEVKQIVRDNGLDQNLRPISKNW